MSEPLKILILKPSSFGDIIHTLPVLHGLRTALPESKIDWLVAREYEGFLSGHEMINQVIPINKGRWKQIGYLYRTAEELWELKNRLSAERYDMVLDLQGLFRTGLISSFTGAKRRIGFSDSRELSGIFYTERVLVSDSMHAVRKNLLFLDHLGIKYAEPVFPLPEFPLPDGLPENYYVISPGARWETKRWPSVYFREVMVGLSKQMPQFTPVIVGGKDEVGIAGEVLRGMENLGVDLTGKTSLRELGGVLKGAAFMLTNDSGPMHLAAALNTPVFAIFGPTSPERTGPFSRKAVVLSSGMGCSPCFKKRCDNLKCMTGLEPEMLIKIILERYKNF